MGGYFGEGGRCITHRSETQGVAFTAVDGAKLGVAETDCVLQHGRKHRLKIAGGATDNLEHLRRCRLLL